VLYFEERPEVGIRLAELQTIWGACAAWERLRGEGIDDNEILALFAQAKFTEHTLSNDAKIKVFEAIAQQMNNLGIEAAWAAIDTITREARKPSPAAAKIIGQFETCGLTAMEIGDRFVSRFREV
jgi:hypothetical protein